jgi:hypothetical protein
MKYESEINMNVEAQKLEIIRWILNLKDTSIIDEIIKIKKKKFESKPGARKFGCGKNIFTYVSEDFDEPSDDFKDYIPGR